MHEYTTKELPKLKLIYWLTVLSIVITPIISQGLRIINTFKMYCI